MIPLYAPLPYTVEYEGRTYRLLPYYDRVLEATATLARMDMSAADALRYALWLLIDERRYPLSPGLMQAIINTLVEPVTHRSDDTPRSIDYTQDAALIYAAFMQAYHIDLRAERELHWWKFQALLSGLPSDTRLMEIINIRTRPLPQPTKYNHGQIQELQRLKAKYRIRLTEEEAEQQYKLGLQRIAAELMSRG